ncbi:MAG: FAD-dependent oxidoreductase [Rhodobacterales bacterium]|nr:FAD-dependent oxidoreductase [Rhodobacterales bacterium]
MTEPVIVIGAGPGGLAAATTLARAGAPVRLLDEQPAAGGQLYRASERIGGDATSPLKGWLGPDYGAGLPLIRAAQAEANIDWRFDTAVWDIRCDDDGIALGLLSGESVFQDRAAHVVLATGAQERPAPFPGWTLPGVLGIGAAQTLFKDAGLAPEPDVVLAGSGPLLYLFAIQLLNAGITPQAILETAPKNIAPSILPALFRAALRHGSSLVKGLAWRRRIDGSSVPHLYGITDLKAAGDGRVETVSFRHGGREHTLKTSLLLVHDGVMPNTHLTVAARCDHQWNDQQQYWHPTVDAVGRTSQAGLWLVGDGAGILGAEAAVLQGRTAGRALAADLGLTPPDAGTDAADRKALDDLRVLRAFLDRQYPPSPVFGAIADDTIVCRCEAVTAGEIRGLARRGCMGPNQARAFTRAGMGPCMGRQCGNSVGRLMAEELGQPVDQVGHYSARPPIKPVTLAQLASLAGKER